MATMESTLDPRSIAVTVTISGLLLAAVLAAARRDARHVPGLLTWTWGCVTVSLGLGMTAWVSGFHPVITYVLNNVLLNTSIPLMWLGARQFAGQPAPRWPLLATALFTIVFGWLFGVLTTNHPVRVALFSSLLGAWSLVAAYAFLRLPDRALSIGKHLAAWPLILFAFTMALRAGQAVFTFAPSNTNERVPVNAVTYLVGSFVLLSVVVGIIICLNARLASEIRKLAYEDALTGALSRRGLYETLPAWLARHAQGAAVALIDLDHFKSVNDKLGHFAGDELLRLLVRLARERLPANSVFARLGGDEFLLLLPRGHDAVAICSELAQAFAQASHAALPLAAFSPQPGLSAGHAALQGANIKAFDAATRAADANLYSAKGERDKPMRYLRSSDAARSTHEHPSIE